MNKTRKNCFKRDDDKIVLERFWIGIRIAAILFFVVGAFYYSGGFDYLKTLRKTDSNTSQIIKVEQASDQNSSKNSESSPNESRQKNEEIKAELKKRAENIKSQLTYRADGKEELYYDYSYGGDENSNNPEASPGKLEIPALGMSRDIFKGIGSTSESPNGDFNRLYNTVTVRAYQALGASNYVLASHVYIVEGSTEHSNDWFTPLMTDQNGVVTGDLSKLKIKIGDEISVTESSTGWKFVFKVSNIELGEKGDSEDVLYKNVNYENLSAHVGEPMITLQGCLAGSRSSLLFIRGKLDRVEAGDTIYRP